MFTPRNLRKSTRPNKSGPGKAEKSKSFRFAKQLSDQFIHQSASVLEGRLRRQYNDYCSKADGFKNIRK